MRISNDSLVGVDSLLFTTLAFSELLFTKLALFLLTPFCVNKSSLSETVKGLNKAFD
ncbi:hypothetical protein GAGA_3969 [Paraglaciecola agarilytica NO2]|uniref:Uncharacterized protein n=1 Tax=Paraglaciecola agarilytica NO2 TaxID=1125747 RepID=A0ABQ0IBM9_9ALTE|nr:hypothetical protein GAGA_3969 [Paraglaciecola agarilytica NO2]